MKKGTIHVVIHSSLVFQSDAPEPSHIFGVEAVKLGKFLCKAFAELRSFKLAFGRIFLENREQSAYGTRSLFFEQAAIMNKTEDFLSPFLCLKKYFGRIRFNGCKGAVVSNQIIQSFQRQPNNIPCFPEKLLMQSEYLSVHWNWITAGNEN